MLVQRALRATGFGRRDAVRFATSLTILVLILTAILGADILPARVSVQAGDIAGSDIRAPKTADFESGIQTDAARQEARAAVPPQYDYTTARGANVATAQARALADRVAPVEAAFAASNLTAAQRKSVLQAAIPELGKDDRTTLASLTRDRWKAVRDEAARVLDDVERAELRDTQLADVRATLEGRIEGDLTRAERSLATALIAPLVVPNSSYSLERTQQQQEKAAEAVPAVREHVAQGETLVRAGDQVTALDVEKIQRLGLDVAGPDFTRLAGWFVLADLLMGLLLGWLWRFRPKLWHRNNVLLLLGFLLAFGAFALKLSAGRSILPFFVPTAAVSILTAILLDGGIALVMAAMLALIAGTVGTPPSLEFASYVLLGGLAGSLAIRKGDRLHNFVEAGVAVAIVNALVVTAFSLLGEQDLRGVLELWTASAAAGGGAAVAAVGSFAVLGNVFGITTVFQLLELANPSQPLLRRLLLETPGTYHHALMVGNLAERAAESIGGDPLLARVAAYYHDIGKLANPTAYTENQAGIENVHEQLSPDESAQLLKSHVAAGIDIAYAEHLPKSLIAFIPQHHGTALMSYFYAKAREEAAAPLGGLETAGGRAAADAVDQRRFRHVGPKPQSKEAAIIMLADGVEASVRSLTARDEPAIRAMVGRIIDERVSDGQFDECDVTLRDVEQIRESFVKQLLGMYHQRIAYPQNKIVELESRRAAGGGTGG